MENCEMSVKPFKVQIPQETLDDLQERLLRSRWTDEVEDAGWDYGTNLNYLKELVNYWQNNFDWRSQEKYINRFAHFQTEIDDLNIHFIHERGEGQTNTPLILLHGWPSSFLQMLKITPLLTDPKSQGSGADAFDVIVPSLPGYGFSDRSYKRGMTVARIAELIFKLMTEELGYERFAVRGSDMGAGVAKELALTYPDVVIGLHLSGTNPYIGAVPQDLSEAEQQFIAKVQQFQMQEFAYAMLQSTKPQTVAYGLNDSPVGLAAWIIEKFRAWSDCNGDIEKRFSKDELLTNLTLYWATATINSSMRLYYESGHAPSPNAGKRVELPTAMAMFPKDMVPGPREWIEREYNIKRWTEMPRGGHFGEWEEPELLAEDIHAFFGLC
jgi:pimeloyl-ACP methyl ester carboxylesterase